MKILLTVHQFLPEHASGTEILTLHTAQELQRRGHDVTVITGFPAKVPLADADRFNHYTYQGLRVERFLHAHVPSGLQANIVEAEYNQRLFYRWFRAYLAARRPDVVHFFHLSRLSASAIEAAVEEHLPTVFTPTDFWAICPTCQLRLPNGDVCAGPRWLGANCVRHVLQTQQTGPAAACLRHLPWPLLAVGVALAQAGLGRSADAAHVRALSARLPTIRRHADRLDRVLVPTRIMRAMLIANGFRAERLQYVPYGVDLSTIRRRTDRGRNSAVTVGFIGTLSEHKGCHILIAALRSLPPAIPIRARIYGSLTEFPDFAQALRALAGNDPRIEFLGTFPNAQIGAVVDELDVLVVPSIWYENTPLVIYSAFAAGCPVMATNLGGMAEVVQHEGNGLLFGKGDVAGLAAHMARLAADRALLQALSVRTATPKSIAEYVDECEAVYAEIASTRRMPSAAPAVPVGGGGAV